MLVSVTVTVSVTLTVTYITLMGTYSHSVWLVKTIKCHQFYPEKYRLNSNNLD